MQDPEIFEGKTLSSLLKDIHKNTVDKRESINKIIMTLVPMIKTSDDVVTLAPILREFFDVGIKNDDHLIKVATIVQRIASAEAYKDGITPDGSATLTEAERDTLIKNALEGLSISVNEVDASISSAQAKLHGNS